MSFFSIVSVKFFVLKLLLLFCWVQLMPTFISINPLMMHVEAIMAQSKEFMSGKVLRIAVFHV